MAECKTDGHIFGKADRCIFCGYPTTNAELAEHIWSRAEHHQQRRAAAMPTEQDAINAMFEAWQRLKELGWSEASYCPKDGSWFDSVEPGSTGIHTTQYTGEWPNGSWWVSDGGDLWPARPTLWRPSQTTDARHE